MKTKNKALTINKHSDPKDIANVRNSVVLGAPDPEDIARMVNPNSTRAEDIRIAVQSAFDENQISLKSVLEDQHLAPLIVGEIQAKYYNDEVLASLVQVVKENLVSVKGRGRKDLVAILTALGSSQQPQPQVQQNRGFIGRLIGQ